MKLLKTKRSFRKELKRQLRYAIAAAVGFLVIYAWKDAIISLSKHVVLKMIKTAEVSAANSINALFITFIGVLIIIVSSRLLKE